MDMIKLIELRDMIVEAFKTEEGRSYWVRGMVERGEICKAEAGFLLIDMNMGTVRG